jgi:helix-turn-helix protein/uncharacterized protein DUF4115
MFELGSSLREARDKRGLDLDAVQRELRIRKRYLEAIEDERFELLPGEVYTRGFIRSYAELLGLDGSICVEEYNARFAVHEEQQIAALPSAPRLHRAPAPKVLVAAVTAVALVAGVAAWSLGAGHSTAGAAPETRAVPAAAKTPVVLAMPQVRVAVPAAPQTPAGKRIVVLKAARGDCWVIVRAGSAAGPVLFENTLQRGRSLRLPLHTTLWVRFGAGRNVDAWVGGRALRSVPAGTGNVLLQA